MKKLEKKSNNVQYGLSMGQRIRNKFQMLMDELSIGEANSPTNQYDAAVVKRAQKMWNNMSQFDRDVIKAMNFGEVPKWVDMKLK